MTSKKIGLLFSVFFHRVQVSPEIEYWLCKASHWTKFDTETNFVKNFHLPTRSFHRINHGFSSAHRFIEPTSTKLGSRINEKNPFRAIGRGRSTYDAWSFSKSASLLKAKCRNLKFVLNQQHFCHSAKTV